MHPETRITANSPMMMSVVVYFLGMVTLPVDILQYFLLCYLHFIIWFFGERIETDKMVRIGKMSFPYFQFFVELLDKPS